MNEDKRKFLSYCAHFCSYFPPFPMRNVVLSQSSITFLVVLVCVLLDVAFRQTPYFQSGNIQCADTCTQSFKWNSSVYKHCMLELKLCWLRKLYVVSRNRISKPCIITRVWNSSECSCNGWAELRTKSSHFYSAALIISLCRQKHWGYIIMLCNVSSPWQGRWRSGNDLFQRNKFKASAKLPDILAENFSLFSSASLSTCHNKKVVCWHRLGLWLEWLVYIQNATNLFKILGVNQEKRDLTRYDLH